MSDPSVNHIIGTGRPASDYLQSRFTPASPVNPTAEGFWCPLSGNKVYHDFSVYSGVFSLNDGARSTGSVCTLSSYDTANGSERSHGPILAAGGHGELDIALGTVVTNSGDHCATCELPTETQVWEFRDEIFDFKPVGELLTEIPRSCKIHGLDVSSIQPGILTFSNGLYLSGGRASTSPLCSTASFAPVHLIGDSHQLSTLLHSVVGPFTCLSALSKEGNPLIVPQSQDPQEPLQGVGIADHQLQEYLSSHHPIDDAVDGGRSVRDMRIPQSGL